MSDIVSAWGSLLRGNPEAPLIKWWEEAMRLHLSAVYATQERHFRLSDEATMKLRNHLQSIPLTIPPGYALVKISKPTIVKELQIERTREV